MAEAARVAPAAASPAPKAPDRTPPRVAEPKPKPKPGPAPLPKPLAAQTATAPGVGVGAPLPPTVASAITGSLGVDVSPVRVHSDPAAATAAGAVGARAFAVGSNVFLGPGERPTDTALMAHEVAHVVQQQGAPRVQLFTRGGTDGFEREASAASSAVVRSAPFTVRERTQPRVQRLGISDALDYFADKANNIPGYRMLTIILGFNPINMSSVERSAANILRAIIEFIPGGHLITEALDKYGVFDKVGNWVEQQIKTLGMTGAMFKKAIGDFLDSLSWRDIFHLGSLWDRAKRIFTDPIDRLIDFGKGLVTGILKFIKDAILMPLAKLAEGTRGWDLLIAVLGKNPITGDPVPRTAETLIGGFMKLIGQEEVWNNMKKANAIARAWAWFQTALSELLALVRSIPTRFIDALKSLEIVDIVVLPRAFVKVGKVFVGFVVDFVSWGLRTVWNLLEIIFDVVSPGALRYIKKTGAAIKSIFKNPLPFVRNLGRAAKLGFQNFASNFLEHLKAGLLDWLTGSLPGIYIPKAFSIVEILKFVLSILGLSWANVRQKLVKVVGEPAVKAMEVGFDIVVTLVRDGPAAAWDKIKEHLSNLKQMVIDGIIDLVVDAITKKAVPKLIAMFIPGAGFISAILSIYDMVMVFVQKIAKIVQVVTAFVDSIVNIAAGQVDAAANKVESVLAGLLSLAINFLAGFAGLGKIADKIMGVVAKIRAPIDKGLDALIAWIVTMAKKLFTKVFGKDKEKDKPTNDPAKQAKITAGLAMIDTEDEALAKDGKMTRDDAEGVASRVKKAHPVFTSITVKDAADRWDYEYAASPKDTKTGKGKKPTGTEKDPFEITWVKPALTGYPKIRLAPPEKVVEKRKKLKKRGRLPSADVATIDGSFLASPSKSRTLGNKTIGVTNADSQIKDGFKFVAKAQVTGNSQKDSFNDLVERWGYNRDEGPTDGDHVLEKQLGGPDDYANVWPLDSSTNRTSGSHVRGEITRLKTDYKLGSIVGKWIKLKF